MKKKIRILAVEDSQDDALLLARTLRESGYDPHLVRVDTAEALSEALETAEWDIVFADYFLRNVRGLDALRLIEEKGLDL
ncbi:MAG: response regulator, partial [Deltaproteobacteria bacterium]|nr:response regulator [Deltaproteobacteria bacterium]